MARHAATIKAFLESGKSVGILTPDAERARKDLAEWIGEELAGKVKFIEPEGR